tara:strand:+ start:4166 stop:6469 length:2304 start_codon:yes stop_codon:yes gene_type:complete
MRITLIVSGAIILCLVAAYQFSQPLIQGSLVGAAIVFLLGGVLLKTRSYGADVVISDALANVVAHDPDFAFLTNSQGEILLRNEAAKKKFEATDEQALGSLLTAIVANPDVVLYRLITRANAMGGGKEEIVTRSGQYGLSVSKIDQNTYLWRLEEGIRNEHSNIRASDALSIPMMTLGQRGAVLFVNEACRVFLGSRPKSMREVFGDVIPRTGLSCRLASVGGEVAVTIAMVESKAGRTEIYIIPRSTKEDEQSGPRELAAEWDAIEDLPVPLLKISADGEVLASNREARGLLDITSTKGKRVSDVLDGLGRPFGDWLREAIEGRGGYVSQFLRGRGENRDIFVQVTLNTAGGVADPHLIAVLNDVTELKTLEAQFVQSQKMQAIGQLAGGVAHDFNNLLTAISGHCDLLLLRHDQGDQNYGDLIQIHQNSNRAASLVGQLLAFSRKQNLQPEVIDIRDTLSDLTHLLNRLVGEKVVLSLSHAQDLDPIRADKRQLEQVLMNLVVNARDAMPAGGEIRVVTQNLTLEKPVLRDRATVPPGDYVVVKVVDEGHGISPEKMSKIFEPFYTTKRTGEGTGLGLSTAYGIVKQTGGFIFVNSEVDRGTEFSLLFPVYEMAVAELKPVTLKAVKSLSVSDEGVVLLVEDEAPVRAFASRALRLRGYTVLEADCAEAALAMLDDPDLAVDIFVTDVIMPGKNGPTWVREALLERPRTRVVFVSGYAEDAFGDEGPRVSNAVFLPKPFSLNELTTTVQAQLEILREENSFDVSA